MEYGLIGERLGHSFSKIIHNKINSYNYELKELLPAELEPFMLARDFKGINVTIPYKKDVISYLSHIDASAEKIGAVNTVVNRGGELYGYNTDIFGLEMLIKRVLALSGRADLSGLKVLITGTGGTSLTAAAAAEALGAAAAVRVSRSGRDGALTYREAEAEFADAGFIINCTPCGMFPDDENMPMSLSPFTGLAGVVDVIYNPLRTRLVRSALDKGIPAEGGLYMLVAQAVSAYELFFGTEAEKELTDGIYSELFSQKENIVLIGMPASGKTTVGKYVAKKLGRRFIDSDSEIEKTEGMSIPDIFAQRGEKYFREVESRIISELSSGINGAVIATGGGAVLNRSNIDKLKANGRVYWLDRPLEALMPTADRPTASNFEDIKKRFMERFPLYKSLCDARVPAYGNIDVVGKRIIKDFLKNNG